MIQKEFERIGETDERIDIEEIKREAQERKVRTQLRSERRQTKVKMTGQIS